MVEFTYSQCPDNRFLVDVSGHAEYGPAGCDVVCAAASILALDIADIARQFERQGKTHSLYVSTGKGRVELDVQIRKAYVADFLAALRTVGNGFALLEASYPDNVICT